MILLFCLLAGCSILEPKVDVGALARECMLLDRDTTVISTDKMKKLECRR